MLFIGLLMYKTHDDFIYYHYPYTLSLIEFKKIFGVGNLEHGFRTPSSIFYLNSLFYLPFAKYYLFYVPTLLIMGFSNQILISRILKYFRNKKIDFIFFLSVCFFIFINIFFYRLQEHGTDRSAQILILILFLRIEIKFSKKYIILCNTTINFTHVEKKGQGSCNKENTK